MKFRNPPASPASAIHLRQSGRHGWVQARASCWSERTGEVAESSSRGEFFLLTSARNIALNRCRSDTIHNKTHLILKWDYPRSGLAEQQFFVLVAALSKSLRSQAHRVLVRELKAARQRAGMSQQEVADKLSVPQSFVAKIELGERRIDVVEFLRLMSALDASAAKILSEVSAELK